MVKFSSILKKRVITIDKSFLLWYNTNDPIQCVLIKEDKMKKIIVILMLVVMLNFTSCSLITNDQKEIESMFNSFDKSQDYVLLTHFQLVVKGEQYDRSEIKYNGKETNIVFLDEEGFYSYTFDEADMKAELLYTVYNGFEVTELGEATLPSKVINSFFGDNCFCFRIDDPSVEEFKQVYYCWNIADKTGKIIEDVEDNYEYSLDRNRSKDYTFNYKSGITNNALEIVDNKSGVKKVIDESVLETFEEGRKINKFNSTVDFGPERAYAIGDDIFFVSGFGVKPSGKPHYYYIVKWNFTTEECTFVTSVRFDKFQEWVDDMIIISSES